MISNFNSPLESSRRSSDLLFISFSKAHNGHITYHTVLTLYIRHSLCFTLFHIHLTNQHKITTVKTKIIIHNNIHTTSFASPPVKSSIQAFPLRQVKSLSQCFQSSPWSIFWVKIGSSVFVIECTVHRIITTRVRNLEWTQILKFSVIATPHLSFFSRNFVQCCLFLCAFIWLSDIWNASLFTFLFSLLKISKQTHCISVLG